MAITTFTAAQVLTAAQMNAVQSNDFNQTVSTKTANYVLVAADKGTRLVMNAAGSTSFTINTSLFSAGDTVVLQNIGAGTCTVTAGTATVSSAGPLAIPQNGGGTLYFTSAGVAIFFPSAVTAASSGLTLIAAASAGATSSLNITGCFSSSYKNYLVQLYQISMSSSNNDIDLRYGTSGTPDTASTYYYAIDRVDGGGTGGIVGAVNQSSASLGANYGNFQGGSSINLTICNPFDAQTTFAQGMGIGNYTTNNFYCFNFHTQKNTTTSYTDLVIFPSAGTITVNYAIYGLAAS